MVGPVPSEPGAAAFATITGAQRWVESGNHFVRGEGNAAGTARVTRVIVEVVKGGLTGASCAADRWTRPGGGS